MCKHVSFTCNSDGNDDKNLNRLALTKDTEDWKLYKAGTAAKSRRSSRLGNSRTISDGWFHFAVKVNFEGKCSGIKNRSAVLAVAQVMLDLAAYFGCEPAFQIFADQTNRSLTRHAHGRPPVPNSH